MDKNNVSVYHPASMNNTDKYNLYIIIIISLIIISLIIIIVFKEYFMSSFASDLTPSVISNDLTSISGYDYNIH